MIYKEILNTTSITEANRMVTKCLKANIHNVTIFSYISKIGIPTYIVLQLEKEYPDEKIPNLPNL